MTSNFDAANSVKKVDLASVIASDDMELIRRALLDDQIMFNALEEASFEHFVMLLHKAKKLEVLNDVLDCPHYYIDEKNLLQCACAKGRLQIVQLILEINADRQLKDGSKDLYAFTLAFDNGHHDICELFFKYPFPKTCLFKEYGYVRPFLHTACFRSQLNFVRLLLRYGPPTEIHRPLPAFNDLTPVGVSCEVGNVDILNLLLDHGGTVDQRALDLALNSRNMKLVRSLLEHGNVAITSLGHVSDPEEAASMCSLTAELGYSMIWDHCFFDLKTLSELDAFITPTRGISGIVENIFQPYWDDRQMTTFRLYLELGLDPKLLLKGFLQMSSLSNTSNISQDMLVVLLCNGTFDRVKNTHSLFFSRNMLMACQHRQFFVAKLLAEFGARFIINQNTDFVFKYGGEPVIDVLLASEGFNPNATSSFGNSLLMIACRHILPMTVEKLLQAGADPNYCTSTGRRTALLALAEDIPVTAIADPTITEKAQRIVGLLLAAGADPKLSGGDRVVNLFRKKGFPQLADMIASGSKDKIVNSSKGYVQS